MNVSSALRGRGLGLVLALVGAVAVLSTGCDRTYLTPTHGRAYREIFAVQTVNPNRRASDENAVHGLDSQEAAIVSSSYRKGLSPKDESSSNQQQLLMYSPRGGIRDASMPPPSVPNSN